MHYHSPMSAKKSPPAPQSPQALASCTCGSLRRLTRRVTALYDQTLAPTGLRVTQYSLLSHLRAPQAPTLSALARAMDMDRTTLSRNLVPLVDAGWVELVAAGSGRTRLARLTPAGVRKCKEAHACWREAQDTLTQAIGPAEVAKLHATIDDYLFRLRPLVRGT